MRLPSILHRIFEGSRHNDRTKQQFLAGAAALLFPIDWPEPFGLVMIEAMACGTPVIAFRSGSVPEVIDEGITGFVVETEEEAVQAIPRLLQRAPGDERRGGHGPRLVLLAVAVAIHALLAQVIG